MKERGYTALERLLFITVAELVASIGTKKTMQLLDEVKNFTKEGVDDKGGGNHTTDK